jgi:hypothetical protein
MNRLPTMLPKPGFNHEISVGPTTEWICFSPFPLFPPVKIIVVKTERTKTLEQVN